jgi:hypothetical protein
VTYSASVNARRPQQNGITTMDDLEVEMVSDTTARAVAKTKSPELP